VVLVVGAADPDAVPDVEADADGGAFVEVADLPEHPVTATVIAVAITTPAATVCETLIGSYSLHIGDLRGRFGPPEQYLPEMRASRGGRGAA